MHVDASYWDRMGWDGYEGEVKHGREGGMGRRHGLGHRKNCLAKVATAVTTE